MQLRPRTKLLLVAIIIVVGGIAFFLSKAASPQSAADSSANIPSPVALLAAQSNVTGLRRIGPVSLDGLGWFSGTDATGQTVVSVGSPRSVSPFVPIQRIYDATELEVFSADAGSTLDSVSSREVAGLVRPDVSRVELGLEGGGTQPVALVDHAFVYTATKPEPFPMSVVAYDDKGTVVAKKDLLAPSVPGE